jgi:hypothetical protein
LVAFCVALVARRRDSDSADFSAVLGRASLASGGICEGNACAFCGMTEGTSSIIFGFCDAMDVDALGGAGVERVFVRSGGGPPVEGGLAGTTEIASAVAFGATDARVEGGGGGSLVGGCGNRLGEFVAPCRMPGVAKAPAAVPVCAAPEVTLEV